MAEATILWQATPFGRRDECGPSYPIDRRIQCESVTDLALGHLGRPIVVVEQPAKPLPALDS